MRQPQQSAPVATSCGMIGRSCSSQPIFRSSRGSYLSVCPHWPDRTPTARLDRPTRCSDPDRQGLSRAASYCAAAVIPSSAVRKRTQAPLAAASNRLAPIAVFGVLRAFVVEADTVDALQV
jgi:hypothetical protein